MTALRLSCDAPVVGAVHKFVGDGIDLCLGRQTRKIPANLRRALGIRDGGCRWPGCHRVTHLQAHHVWHWAHGGPTDPINLVLLCRTHHMLLHEGGFSIAWALGRPGTSWVVTDPTGCPVSESRLFNPGPSTRPAHSEMADPGPDAIRSGWAGERFRVAETCGVLLDNSLPRHSTSTDGVPSDTCPGTRTAGAKRADSSASGCETTPATAPKEASKPVEMSEQIADHRPPPRDEWFDNLDLTGVSDEELIDGSYWRKLMDELVEAELAQAGPADVKTV